MSPGSTLVSSHYIMTGSTAVISSGAITAQGRLLDSSHAPISDIVFTFVFALYSAPTGGTVLWSESQQIQPANGYFSAKLGDKVPFPSGLLSSGTLYLGITVGTDLALSPREVVQ